MKRSVLIILAAAVAFGCDKDDVETRNEPPVCSITSPRAGANHSIADDLVITGEGSDTDGTITRAVLTVGGKAVDGVTGVPFTVTIPAADLVEGELKIELTVTDDRGATADDRITIVILPPGAPTCAITEPEHGASFPFGKSITVKGTGSDQDGEISKVTLTAGGKVIEAVDKVPFEYEIPASEIPSGNFTIALEVTDNDGLSAKDQVTVVIAENKAPVAKITAPADGFVIEDTDRPLTITGEASDEDGTVEKVVLKIDGTTIGEVTAVPFSYEYAVAHLEPGQQVVIELEATDNAGATGSDRVTVKAAAAEFTDLRDGKVYKTVKLGTQVWMAENLAWLPEVSPGNIGNKQAPHYYVYGYHGTDVNEAKASQHYTRSGVLYNWHAAIGSADGGDWRAVPSGVQGACPDGWHIPSKMEWSNLIDWAYEQLAEEEGVTETRPYATYPDWTLREANVPHLTKNVVGALLARDVWTIPNEFMNDDMTDLNKGGQDRWGFTGMPSGKRTTYGEFFSDNTNSAQRLSIWATNLNDDEAIKYPDAFGNVDYIELTMRHYSIYFAHGGTNKEIGQSVRCIKN